MMRIFYWNIVGIANENSRDAFRNFCLLHRPDIVFIFEPMIIPSDMPFNFWTSCNLRFILANDRENLILNLWL